MTPICDICKSPIDYDNCARFHDDEDGFLCLPCWDGLDEKSKIDYYRRVMIAPAIFRSDQSTYGALLSRVKIAYDLMEYLNEKEDHRGHVFDCEELGVVQLWFTNSWQYQWFDLEPLPDSLSENLFKRQYSIREDLEAVQKIEEWAIAGLLVEGSHHKQYCLEQIVIALGVEVDEEWEPGIAP